MAYASCIINHSKKDVSNFLRCEHAATNRCCLRSNRAPINREDTINAILVTPQWRGFPNVAPTLCMCLLVFQLQINTKQYNGKAKIWDFFMHVRCNRLEDFHWVQAHIFEGKEPPEFVTLFEHMVVLKGGLSSGYKNSMTEKGSPDETYTPESIALIQVSGTRVHNN